MGRQARFVLGLALLMWLLMACELPEAGAPTHTSASATPTVIQLALTLDLSSAPLNQALIKAVLGLDEKKVADLLGRGANPNVRGENSRTSVHEVATGGNKVAHAQLMSQQTSIVDSVLNLQKHQKAIMDLLLAHGADPNAVDIMGHTPLHLAAQLFQQTEIGSDAIHLEVSWATVDLLLAAGADPNAQGPHFLTPLHLAAGKGLALLENLLSAAADPHVRSVDGMTPLHWAAREGRAMSVVVLLAAGADPNARSDGNKAPQDLAQFNGHSEVIALLLAHDTYSGDSEEGTAGEPATGSVPGALL